MNKYAQIPQDGPAQITKDDIDGDAVYVCRCGLTGNGPFCDGSHKHVKQAPEDGIVLLRRENGDVIKESVRSN